MKRRWILPVCVALIVVLGMGNAYKRTQSELGLYVKTGERMLEGSDIYRMETGRPTFAYPPFCGLVTAPMVLVPQKLRRGAWFLVLLGLLLASGVFLRRIGRAAAPWSVGWSPRRKVVFVLLLGALSVRFVLSVLSNQSHDLVIVAMLLAAVHASATGSEVRAGLWAGLAAAFKATPLLFLPVFLWQGRWKASAALLIALVVATLLPDLLFPREDGRRAVSVWIERFGVQASPGDAPAQKATWGEWNLLNQSLAGTVTRLTMSPPRGRGPEVSLFAPSRGTRKLLVLAAQGLVGLLLVWATRPGRDGCALRRTGEGAAVVCAMLLLSPQSSKSHFALLVLPAFFALLVLERRRDITIAVLLAGVFCFGSLLGKGLLPRGAAAWILAAGSVTVTGLCAYAASLRSIALLPRAGEPAVPAD